MNFESAMYGASEGGKGLFDLGYIMFKLFTSIVMFLLWASVYPFGFLAFFAWRGAIAGWMRADKILDQWSTLEPRG